MSDTVNEFGYVTSGAINMQLLATRGYAILMPDTPLKIGFPVQGLLSTVMPGVDKVIELGVADPDRLGVMGYSYGGYSTLALITQTTRFKAAATVAGVGNLFRVYGDLEKDGTNWTIEWAEQGQGRMGGTPWQFRDRYLENSPFFYLDRVQTPLLLTHGTIDTVRAFNSEEVFVGLRRLGKEVTYARYEGEDHGIRNWAYANQIDLNNRIIAWFDKWLAPRSKGGNW